MKSNIASIKNISDSQKESLERIEARINKEFDEITNFLNVNYDNIVDVYNKSEKIFNVISTINTRITKMHPSNDQYSTGDQQQLTPGQTSKERKGKNKRANENTYTPKQKQPEKQLTAEEFYMNFLNKSAFREFEKLRGIRRVQVEFDTNSGDNDKDIFRLFDHHSGTMCILDTGRKKYCFPSFPQGNKFIDKYSTIIKFYNINFAGKEESSNFKIEEISEGCILSEIKQDIYQVYTPGKMTVSKL
jgi:hypothetical protein